MVWAIDFQFDSTIDGQAIKIASMIGEHTRLLLLNIVERSITAERLVDELEKVFVTAGRSPPVLMDNDPELIPKRCKSSVMAGWECPTLRRDAVETGISNCSTTHSTGSVSTTTTEHPARGPRGHR